MDKKTRLIYMVFATGPPQKKKYTQTESKGITEDISCRWRQTNRRAGIAIVK